MTVALGKDEENIQCKTSIGKGKEDRTKSEKFCRLIYKDDDSSSRKDEENKYTVAKKTGLKVESFVG